MGRSTKNNPPAGSASMLCNKCNEVLPPAAFYWKADGTPQAAICKRCWRIYHANRGGYQYQRPIICEWCGAEKIISKENAQFCSPLCKDRAIKKARQDAINAAKGYRECPTCGKALTLKQRTDAVYCSDACNSKAHGVTRKIRKRIGETGPRPRKMPLVSLGSIAKRDGYRCGICGGRVDMTRRHPDPLAASIDHIVMLADGGTNDPTNLQLSHFRCNWSRNQRSA